MGVPGFLGINGIPVSMSTEAFFNATSRSCLTAHEPWPSPHPVSHTHALGQVLRRAWSGLKRSGRTHFPRDLVTGSTKSACWDMCRHSCQYLGQKRVRSYGLRGALTGGDVWRHTSECTCTHYKKIKGKILRGYIILDRNILSDILIHFIPVICSLQPYLIPAWISL